MNSKNISPLLVLLGAVLWGTTGTAQAFAPDTANPLVIGAVRVAIGGFTLLTISLLRGTLKVDKSWPLVSTFIAAVCMAAYQPFFFTAVSRTGIAAGTVAAIGSAPVLSGILSFLVRKEKPEKKWYLATILSITGCFLLFAPTGEENVDVFGVLLALCAGLSYSAYALASKQLLDKYPPDAVIAVVFSISAVMLSPLFFVYNSAWLLDPSGLLAALHLGFFATALAYLLFAKGLAGLPVSTAATLTLAEPLTAAFLGIFLVGERLSFTGLMGITLLFIGLGILSIDTKSKNKSSETAKVS